MVEEQLHKEEMSDEMKQRILAEFEKRETDYTRLQRQRMCYEDFEPLTIIGRGAFGEVRTAEGLRPAHYTFRACARASGTHRCQSPPTSVRLARDSSRQLGQAGRSVFVIQLGSVTRPARDS